MYKLFLIVLLFVCCIFLTASSVSKNGSMQIQEKYEPWGQKHWFATPSGTGNCTSWENACSFRSAVDKTSSSVLDVIHCGAGDFDLDNGTDATGTTISAEHVKIFGMDGSGIHSTKLYNGDAAATKILTITGDNVSVEGLYFSNIGQTSPNVTLLTIQSTNCGVHSCLFVQAPPAASGTCILFDNSASSSIVEAASIRGCVDYGIRTNGAQRLRFVDLNIAGCGDGMSIDGASDSSITIQESRIQDCTVGVEFNNTTGTNCNIVDTHLHENTNQIDDDGDWNEVQYDRIHISGLVEEIYPTASIVQIAGAAGAWTYGSTVTIIPASTITEPFLITRINIIDALATDVYQVELFYGEATANISLGTYMFYTTKAADVEIAIDRIIPANSIVGARVRTEGGGSDWLEMSISYQEY